MMMIVITIINSSRVNPGGRRQTAGGRTKERRFPSSCLLPTSAASGSLPVTIFFTIQSCIFRLRAHIKNVFAAPGIGVCRVVTRTHVPVSLARHRIDRDTAKINFLFRRKLTIEYAAGIVSLSSRAFQSATAGGIPTRYHVYTIDQGLQIRRITVRIINAEDGAVGNHYLTARIDGRWTLLLAPGALCYRCAGTVNANCVSVKLVDSCPYPAQCPMKLLFLLSLH